MASIVGGGIDLILNYDVEFFEQALQDAIEIEKARAERFVKAIMYTEKEE